VQETKRIDSDLAIVMAFAAAKLVFHIATNGQYGFHRDELATLIDARHLDFGYVAYPPLTPFIGRVALTLFGTSLTGFRFFAAVAQCVVIVIAAAMARRLGGGRTAMVVAAGATAVAPISIAASALFQYVSFDDLWVVLMAYLVIRLCESDDPRWWVAIGIAIGLDAETKYTIAFFVAGLVAAVFATPLRRHLRSRWLWIGAAISIVIALPNLVWQVQHDFISLDFLRHIHERDVRIGRTAGFAGDQFTDCTNPLTAPLWLFGLYRLIFTPQGRSYRVLVWMAVVPFVLFLVARGRGYYLAPVYPMLFAAGSAELERKLATISSGWRHMAHASIALLLICGSAVAFLILPLGPIGSPLFRAAARTNGDLVEEIGWPELAREAARIYNSLPPDQRSHAGIYCANYGEAGAIDLYGPAYGLPHAISGVNSYWQRGPGNPPPATLIVLGGSRERLERRFGSVVLAGHPPNPWKVENEETRDHPDIFVCRDPRRPLNVIWPDLRSFG
jgi:4-amino-4-deoxy-L-arabinose transferase-like glycosyltransferase